MIPLNYTANVKLPYYGWFGATFCTCKEARSFIARHYRSARRQGGMFKPSYAARSYTINPVVLAEA